MIKLFLFTLLVPVFAFANRESGGVGAPEIQERCYRLTDDLSKDYGGGPAFQLDAGRYWPEYKLVAVMIDREHGSLKKSFVVEDVARSIGAPVTFRGENLKLAIFKTATPVRDGAKVYYPGRIELAGTAVELKCETGH